MQPVPARWAQGQVADKPPRLPAPGRRAPGGLGGVKGWDQIHCEYVVLEYVKTSEKLYLCYIIQANQVQGVTRLIQCCKFAVLLIIFFLPDNLTMIN